MKTAFEEDEELAPFQTPQDRELTLSSKTLLVIFFGLVLVCGLFFGLGYTLGRRAPGESGTVQTTEAAADATPPFASQPKPSASSQAPAQPATSEPAAQDPPADPPEGGVQNPAAGRNPETTPALPPQAPPAETSDTPPPTVKPAFRPAYTPAQQPPAPVQPAMAIMVQIAAVSNQADADALLGALRKHGYSGAARHEAADTLLHVQVGPFATRAEAVAMRQKLLNDGYNAILK
jgi:DedD protein